MNPCSCTLLSCYSNTKSLSMSSASMGSKHTKKCRSHWQTITRWSKSSQSMLLFSLKKISSTWWSLTCKCQFPTDMKRAQKSLTFTPRKSSCKSERKPRLREQTVTFKNPTRAKTVDIWAWSLLTICFHSWRPAPAKWWLHNWGLSWTRQGSKTSTKLRSSQILSKRTSFRSWRTGRCSSAKNN